MSYKELYQAVIRCGAQDKRVTVLVEIDENGRKTGKLLLPISRGQQLVLNVNVIVKDNDDF